VVVIGFPLRIVVSVLPGKQGVLNFADFLVECGFCHANTARCRVLTETACHRAPEGKWQRA
jgi:hypothetical protein